MLLACSFSLTLAVSLPYYFCSLVHVVDGLASLVHTVGDVPAPFCSNIVGETSSSVFVPVVPAVPACENCVGETCSSALVPVAFSGAE